MTARKPKAEPTVDPKAEVVIPIPKALLPQSFEKVDICPKCGGDYLKWEYHPYAVLSENCGRRLAQADVAIGSDWWNLYPEHQCVLCNQCKYSWVMGVFADVV